MSSNLIRKFRSGAAGFLPRVRRGARRRFGFLIVPVVIWSLAGCTAIKLGVGSDGADMDRVRTGIVQAEVEAVLGPPLFAKGSRETIWYATYAVDQGQAPQTRQH